jgi:hypothetical protein
MYFPWLLAEAVLTIFNVSFFVKNKGEGINKTRETAVNAEL